MTILCFRLQALSRLKGWCCGPSDRADSCPVGERLAGACSHCSSAVYLAGVLAYNPHEFKSTHRTCHVIDRAANPSENEEIVSEVLG